MRVYLDHDADTRVTTIRRALRGSQRRQEDRAYACPDDPAVWHTTSRTEAS